MLGACLSSPGLCVYCLLASPAGSVEVPALAAVSAVSSGWAVGREMPPWVSPGALGLFPTAAWVRQGAVTISQLYPVSQPPASFLLSVSHQGQYLMSCYCIYGVVLLLSFLSLPLPLFSLPAPLISSFLSLSVPLSGPGSTPSAV